MSATTEAALLDLLQQRAQVAGRRPFPGLGRLRGWVDGTLHRQRLRLVEAAASLLHASAIVRPIPDFDGEFELGLRSHVTRGLLLGDFEGDLLPLVRLALQPGQHVIDVGANIGLYTVFMARRVGPSGRVLAVEPTPNALALLRRNLARNQVTHCEIFEGVVSDHSGAFSLNVAEGNEEYSSLGAMVHPAAPDHSRRTCTVAGETLDALALRHGLRPSFLKIDVEGAEELVLRGARAVLDTARPILLSELDDRLLQPLGASAASVCSLLAAHRYRVFDAHAGRELGASPGAPFVGEILAVPLA